MLNPLKKLATYLGNYTQEHRRLALRAMLSLRYLRGRGIEIGALHRPLWLSPWARAAYVDRLDNDGLRAHYPELQNLPLIPVDIIADGETLDGIGDGSQDFVIANHFIEHCRDPIGAMAAMARTLRPGGCLYLTAPDKRLTFDRHRPITPFAHCIEDHREPSAGRDWHHFDEWVRLVEADCRDPEARAAKLIAEGYSIHYHVWDDRAFKAFVGDAIAHAGLSLRPLAWSSVAEEVICVLHKD